MSRSKAARKRGCVNCTPMYSPEGRAWMHSDLGLIHSDGSPSSCRLQTAQDCNGEPVCSDAAGLGMARNQFAVVASSLKFAAVLLKLGLSPREGGPPRAALRLLRVSIRPTDHQESPAFGEVTPRFRFARPQTVPPAAATGSAGRSPSQ